MRVTESHDRVIGVLITGTPIPLPVICIRTELHHAERNRCARIEVPMTACPDTRLHELQNICRVRLPGCLCKQMADTCMQLRQARHSHRRSTRYKTPSRNHLSSPFNLISNSTCRGTSAVSQRIPYFPELSGVGVTSGISGAVVAAPRNIREIAAASLRYQSLGRSSPSASSVSQ